MGYVMTLWLRDPPPGIWEMNKFILNVKRSAKTVDIVSEHGLVCKLTWRSAAFYVLKSLSRVVIRINVGEHKEPRVVMVDVVLLG